VKIFKTIIKAIRCYSFAFLSFEQHVSLWNNLSICA